MADRSFDVNVIDLDNLTPELNALFNDSASEIRNEFNALIEQLSLPNVRNIDWIVSTLASRNKYFSPLFIRCCRLAFVKRLIDDGHNVREIVLADRPLAELLQAHFRQQGRNIAVRCTERFLARGRRLIRPIRQYAVASVLLCLRCLGRSRAWHSRTMPSEPIVLIDTFVLNNGGDEGGIVNDAYKDRYYSGLWEQLTDEEKRQVFFVPTIVGFRNPWRAFNSIRRVNFPFLISDDYLTVGDYLYILGYPFRALMLDLPDVAFRGFDLTNVINQERSSTCTDFISLLGLLNYRFADRLAQHHVRVRLLIDWYENQVMDRGMIVGFHRFHSATKIVGYQGYVIATTLHIYTHPNRTEQIGQAVPDVVAVTGRGLVEDIREFCPDVCVDVAPGFRFQKLWRKRELWPDSLRFTVLVALPINLDDSAHILRELTNDPGMLEDPNLRFAVKPHPTNNPQQIRRLLPGTWPESLEILTGDFHDCLEKSNLLITNASSVSLEALAKGVPVIVIAPATGILQNPIPKAIDPNLWAVCGNAVELVEQVRRFQKRKSVTSDGIAQTGEELRREYFEPVTRLTVASFLELN